MLHMNMKTKLLSAFVVVSVVTALLGIYANSIIHHIDDNDTNIYEGNTDNLNVYLKFVYKIHENCCYLFEIVRTVRTIGIGYVGQIM